MNAARGAVRRQWGKNWPLWVGLLAVALEILLTTHLVEHAAEENEVVHDTQHGLMMVGLIMGYALHDRARGLLSLRGGPDLWTGLTDQLSSLAPLLTIAFVFLAEVALISPPVDHFSDTHKAVHYAVHGGDLHRRRCRRHGLGRGSATRRQPEEEACLTSWKRTPPT